MKALFKITRRKSKASKERQANAELQAIVNEHAQSIRDRLKEARVSRVKDKALQESRKLAMAPLRDKLVKENSYYQTREYLTRIYNPDDISIEDKDLAYIAGVFDGEVSLGIRVSSNSYVLTISYDKANYEVLKFFENTFGGVVRQVKKQPYHRFQVWEWHLTSGYAYRAIRKLYPFLYVKKERAATCLAFFEHYWQGDSSISVSNRRQAIGAKYKSLLQEYQPKPSSGTKTPYFKQIKQQESTFVIPKNIETRNIPKNYLLPDIPLPELQLSYIAGLLDVDSSFNIYKISNRPSYLLEVNSRKTDYNALQYLANIFGGRVRPTLLGSGNKREPWLWKIVSARAYRLIKHIYPYLRVKRRAAEICMEFFELYWQGRSSEPVSPERQAIGAKYVALLRPHLIKSMPHRKKSIETQPV